MKKLWLACAFLTSLTLTAFAADNLWVGTWKLDVSKSQFAGDTFTYSKAQNGMMHYSDGSTVDFDFGIDGKEYKTAYGRTTTWTSGGNNTWDSVSKMDGKVLANNHRELSSDGKTLTVTSSGTKPDGSPFMNVTVYTRVTGTDGLEGKWRSVKVDISASDSLVITEPSPGVLRWELPEVKGYVEGKADGTDHPVTGPTVPPGLTYGFKLVTPTEITYTQKLNGKPDTHGIQTVAADGKSFTDVSWSPGKESEKSTAVYVKQ